MNWDEAVRALMNDPTQQAVVRRSYYDLPLLNAAERYYASPEWDSVRRKIPRPDGGRALDVGAGNGLVSYSLARDGWAVTAVEPDSSDLVGCGAIRQLAEDTGLNINVVQGITDDLDVPPGAFDAILVRQVFHHAPDIDRFATGLAALLSPDGTLLTWRDHVISKPEDLQAFFDGHPLHRLYGGENAFTEKQYEAALEKAGLRIIAKWRFFDDSMNYGPMTPSELFTQAAAKVLPTLPSRLIGVVFGNSFMFGTLAPVFSMIDRRPGRLVAYLARKAASNT